jgi:virulence-associated protein VapD
MLMAPAAASQLIFESVGMDDNTKVATAATATNTAVQVAWLETAFSPMEMLRMADPETNTQSVVAEVSTTAHRF